MSMMSSRLQLPVLAAVILAILCLIKLLWITSPEILKTTERNVNRPTLPVAKKDTLQISESFKKQRNELARILNGVKQELGVMSCEMIELKRKLKMDVPSVSKSGGWCKRTSYNNSGSHAFDKSLATELSRFFEGKRVASFGDGPGDYKRFIDSTHRVAVYDAYDGAPFGPETSAGAVKFLDLTAPQYGLPVYDWVMSLEVAEHIPAKYESIYVDNIVRHAGVGIVLSWAVVGQAGLSHVNNRPLPYVQNMLSEKGFDTDKEASDTLQKSATLTWLKRNVYVYRRRQGSTANPLDA